MRLLVYSDPIQSVQPKNEQESSKQVLVPSFQFGSGSEKIGLLVQHGVLKLQSALDFLLSTAPQMHDHPPFDRKNWQMLTENMNSFIEYADLFEHAIEQLKALDQQKKIPADLYLKEAEITLLSPVPHPTSMRDGYAFRQHVEAARRNRGVPMIAEFDQFPVFYFTNHLAVTGPGDVPVRKLAQDKLDFELEVAVVIGKRCSNVPAAEADQVIFGYMIMNDWSARSLQMEEMKLNLGPAKGKDFATSLGPYLVTRDELAAFAVKGPSGERHDLKMKAYVNGKLLSEGNLKDMTWTFAQIIERASYAVTLHPGDVIGSGTVGTGCLLELNGSRITDNLWIRPGDQVTLEVEQLGRLENTIVGLD